MKVDPDEPAFPRRHDEMFGLTKRANRCLSVKDFEHACEREISGSLWDATFNADYTHHVSLSVSEMRYIANVLRDDQRLPRMNVIDPFEHIEKD